MSRLTLLVVAVLGACLVLAGTAYADETETPTPEPEPPVVETAVAPDVGETPAPVDETPPVDGTPAPDDETPPVDETPVPVPPRPVEPGPPPTAEPDGGDVIAPAPVEPAPGTEELIIAPPATGAGSPSGGSWAWWPLAVAAGAAAGAAGVLLAYQGRRAKS
jgi:hypothetical protein